MVPPLFLCDCDDLHVTHTSLMSEGDQSQSKHSSCAFKYMYFFVQYDL